MPSQNEIREQITKQIIEALENGVRPWQRPWVVNQSSGRHRNYTSQRPYSGINPAILQLHSMQHGFSSPLWGTFKQWQQIGGRVQQRPKHVKPGQWGAKIVFFAPLKKTVVNRHTGDEEEKSFPILRTFTVFNADQVDGLNLRSEPANTNVEPDFAPAEELIAATGAEVQVGGNRAFYQ